MKLLPNLTRDHLITPTNSDDNDSDNDDDDSDGGDGDSYGGDDD